MIKGRQHYSVHSWVRTVSVATIKLLTRILSLRNEQYHITYSVSMHIIILFNDVVLNYQQDNKTTSQYYQFATEF